MFHLPFLFNFGVDGEALAGTVAIRLAKQSVIDGEGTV
jgi:hypothetical protein